MKTFRTTTAALLLMLLTNATALAAMQVHYVDLNCTNPVPPYTNWVTATTNIQDAVDASTDGDLILVTNGVYATGGRVVYGALTNLVVIDKAVTMRSVNGPAVTTIRGGGIPYSDSAVRCVYLTNGVMLAGFTITNGSTRAVSWPTPTPENCGGGVWCESVSVVISNCMLVGNTAFFDGGAAYGGTLVNCTLTNNTSSAGGGASSGILTNCTLIGNSASSGGGAYQCILDTSTINQNSTGSGGGGVLECTLNHCALLNNSAGGGGGGSYNSTLSNCTLSGNTVLSYGGGAAFGTLVNCTLTGNTVNMTYYGSGTVSGGGAYGATLNNCVVSGNQVINSLMGNSPTYGGGVSGGVLNSCLLSGNSCKSGGGGAYNATLNNCTIVGNSDQPLFGGGAYDCTVYNSILRYNGINYAGSSLNYCCTTPLPGGIGNIVADPLFVNQAGGDYHLQANSPCINSGNNTFVTNNLDLDGNLRIVGGTVDIGAYEYQTPVSKISYAWLQQYGLSITTNTDTADPDGDRMNNYQEWIAGTNPTNALSVLTMLAPEPTNNPAGLVASWQSVNNRTYFLQSRTNLGMQPSFSTIQSNIVGQTGTTSYTDTNAVGNGPFFYRVGVQQ